MTTNNALTQALPDMAKSARTVCQARYHAAGDQIEFDWLNADAPGTKPHGNEFIKRVDLPDDLIDLATRCHEALRHGGRGQWVELTRGVMVSYGVKRL